MSPIWSVYPLCSIIILQAFVHEVGVCTAFPQQDNVTDESDFKCHIESGRPFVDKSEFVKVARADHSEATLIIRPRGFGKSINLSMLKYFLDVTETSSKHLFRDLFISKKTQFCKEHQNKYPVVHINFEDIKGNTYEEALAALRTKMSDLYKKSGELLKKSDSLSKSDRKFYDQIISKSANEASTAKAVLVLMRYLHRCRGIPVVLLVDNYDFPVRYAYLKGYHNSMIWLTRLVIRSAIKNNPSLDRAVVVGSVLISLLKDIFQGSIDIAADPVRYFRYSKYFGFLDENVEELTSNAKLRDVPRIMKQIKKHYGGYALGVYTMYNPRSVSLFLKNRGKLDQYWVKTAGPESLRDLLLNDGVIPALRADMLLSGVEILQPVKYGLRLPSVKFDEATFWSLLTQLGYLTIDGKVQSKEYSRGLHEYVLRLPNKEVGSAFETAIWSYTKKYKAPSYKDFINGFRLKNATIVRSSLESYVKNGGSFFKGRYLSEFGVLMEGLLRGLKQDYGLCNTKRKKGVIIIELGPSKDDSEVLVFVMKQIDVKKSNKKHISMKLCISFGGRGTNRRNLFRNSVFEIKFETKKALIQK